MPKVDSSLRSVGGNTQGVDSQSRASGAQSPNHPEPAVRNAIQRALIALGHQIDADTVRFFRDPDKDTTALAQLCDSLEAAFLALLASPALPKGESEDTERLNWLDEQVQPYGFEGEHEGNRWVVDGPFRNVRVAIDAIRASMSPKSGEQA